MRITLPTIPDPLRSLAWRVREPQLSDLPDVAAATLRAWTGCEPELAGSAEGWPVWWVHTGDALWVIYELHVFVAIVQISGIASEQVAAALAVVLAATIDLSATEPIALAELLSTRG